MKKGELIEAIYKEKLTKRATLVVFYLINRANKEMTCYPGVKTIATECNMSARTVQRALNDLVQAGFLKKESRFHEKGGQRSNLYYLKIAETKRNSSPKNSISFSDYGNVLDERKKERKMSENKGKREEVENKVNRQESNENEINEQISQKLNGSEKYNHKIRIVSPLREIIIRPRNQFIDYCRGG
ncbi:MAG: helix-turn-helix domain-containing protein [Alkaliphilus sp.]